MERKLANAESYVQPVMQRCNSHILSKYSSYASRRKDTPPNSQTSVKLVQIWTSEKKIKLTAFICFLLLKILHGRELTMFPGNLLQYYIMLTVQIFFPNV